MLAQLLKVWQDTPKFITRMRHMKKSILVVAMISGLFSLTALAGNRPGAFTFTVGGAYDFWAPDRNMHNTWLLPTAALAYNFDEHWGIEGGYGTFEATQSTIGGGGSVSGDLYTVAGLYRFNNIYHCFEPFITAGVGVYHINPNGSNAQNQGNINAGLGTEIFFGDSVALRGDVRDVYTWAGSKNDVILGFGVSFLFGGETPTPAPVFKDSPSI
jgi:hypothetical protein